MKKLKEGIFFFKPNLDESRSIPLTNNSISAGFPSPADDFKEIRISLDKEIVRNEEATFYARVDGDSMQGAGLSDGDLIVIDRSEEPKNGSIAVCFLDGEFTVKRLKLKNQEVYLMPENSRYSPIKIDEGSELSIWGIVTYVVKKMI
ncbi:MAG: translesion error-prone DNA polymerase V autoproteolytic subunit [Flavobacteriales bacterium]|nr:MAG: translesion error-prone DNA polymerase V autoproteolytic subunit [Flavobacteriales bacterium TMED96]RZP10612.1 MAG: translesion error-prone DNA polymerase V autoproteolytic subunit [Flavobacteriales bacterium]|tara:strand:+ start:4051 stop:4491 length:441 start_codon:yes stop_codon:yes gene_type:complete